MTKGKRRPTEIDKAKTILVVDQVRERKQGRGLSRYEWAYEMLFVPSLEDAQCIEGWVVLLDDSERLAEHAWVEWRGCILDPFFLHREVIYCPGPRFDRQAAKQGRYTSGAAVRPGELPIVWQRGWRGRDDPDYMAAYAQARESSDACFVCVFR